MNPTHFNQSHPEVAAYIHACIDDLCRGKSLKPIIFIGNPDDTLNAVNYIRFMLEDGLPSDAIHSIADILKKGIDFFSSLILSEKFIVITSNDIQHVKKLPRPFLEACTVFVLSTHEVVVGKDVHAYVPKAATTHEDIEDDKEDMTILYRWNKKGCIVLRSEKAKHPVELTRQESRLFEMLSKDRCSTEEIINGLWESYEVSQKESNVRELRTRLNRKVKDAFGRELISGCVDGYYSLPVEIQEDF